MLDEAISRDEIVAFARRWFGEGGEVADRIRGRRYGWELDTQPREYINSRDFALMTLGNGPILIDRRDGAFWETSSSPGDVFGTDSTPGWSELTSRARFHAWRKFSAGAPSGNIRG
jgi:hypothetical protein